MFQEKGLCLRSRCLPSGRKLLLFNLFWYRQRCSSTLVVEVAGFRCSWQRRGAALFLSLLAFSAKQIDTSFVSLRGFVPELFYLWREVFNQRWPPLILTGIRTQNSRKMSISCRFAPELLAKACIQSSSTSRTAGSRKEPKPASDLLFLSNCRKWSGKLKFLVLLWPS